MRLNFVPHRLFLNSAQFSITPSQLLSKMPVFKVRVKWGKEKFEVEVDTDEPPEVFKMQLFSLSKVPPDRQKVMIGGVTIQNDDWGKAKAKIKENAMLMMMGSAEALPSAPTERPKFIEDMTEAEAASAMLLPSGLQNFGNTCYMNATLQCLKVVPELRGALSEFVYDPSPAVVPRDPQSISIVSSLKLLYSEMDKNQPDMPLLLFMNALHKVKPDFAERDEKTNAFRQQDAHECWSEIVSTLARTLKMATPQTEEGAAQQMKFMEQYFGVQQKTTYKCAESEEEPEKTEIEKSYQLSCFISQNIKYLHTGIKEGLEGSVEKYSESLGRNTQYKKSSKLSRLPGYLTIQLVRFFVGKAGDTEEMVSKKILKDIKFPMKLDLYEFCTPELQEKLLPNRRRYKEVEDKKAAAIAKAITEGKIHGPRAKQQQAELVGPVEYEPFDFPDDPGSNNSANYQLSAVLTHQGRSSSSGHYLAWVRHRSDDWIKLDDDKVSVVKEEDILKLSGGGDWHIAYLLLYSPLRLEKFKEEEPEGAGEKTTTTAEEPMDTTQSAGDDKPASS